MCWQAFSSIARQLRWFLIEPGARGKGLGKKLLHEAVEFSRQKKYENIILWTIRHLETTPGIVPPLRVQTLGNPDPSDLGAAADRRTLGTESDLHAGYRLNRLIWMTAISFAISP